jgi:hypothetical protein
MRSPILSKLIPITITFDLTPGVCPQNVSEARYQRIEQIVQRDLSNQSKNSFHQEAQNTLPSTLVPFNHVQSVVSAVNDES